MPEWLKPILDFLKEFGKYLVPIAIVCALVLYLPAAALEHFGLTALRKEYKPHFSVTLLFCVSVILWNGLSHLWGWVWKKYRAHQGLVSARKRLHALTEMEKRILRSYIQEKARTQSFDMGDGVVCGLQAIGVLHISAHTGSLEAIDFNMSDWAWDYLNEHPETLT